MLIALINLVTVYKVVGDYNIFLAKPRSPSHSFYIFGDMIISSRLLFSDENLDSFTSQFLAIVMEEYEVLVQTKVVGVFLSIPD